MGLSQRSNLQVLATLTEEVHTRSMKAIGSRAEFSFLSFLQWLHGSAFTPALSTKVARGFAMNAVRQAWCLLKGVEPELQQKSPEQVQHTASKAAVNFDRPEWHDAVAAHSVERLGTIGNASASR